MDKKPDDPLAAPSPQYCLDDDDKAVLSSSPSQLGQLDEYLVKTNKKDGKRSPIDDQRVTESSTKGHAHNHSRAEEKMSTARLSRGQDDGVGTLQVKMKPLIEADTKPRTKDLRNDPVTQTQVTEKDIYMDENNAVARHPAAAFYPGAVTTSGKQTSNIDTEPIKEKRSPASDFDDSFVTQTSALGVAALAPTSLANSTGTDRAYKTHGMNSIEEGNPNMRVGATVVPGMSPSRHTSDHSASTNGVIDSEDSLPLRAVGEENPLQAVLVADRVTWANEEEDLEAQVQARIRRMLQNTSTEVVQARKAPKIEDNNNVAGKKRKKIWILAGVLVIAAAIGIALGITLSKPPPGGGVKPTVVAMSGTYCTPKAPCPQCYGDCDTDDDCEGNLVCYQTDGGKTVPSCSGGEDSPSKTDFCIDPGV